MVALSLKIADREIDLQVLAMMSLEGRSIVAVFAQFGLLTDHPPLRIEFPTEISALAVWRSLKPTMDLASDRFIDKMPGQWGEVRGYRHVLDIEPFVMHSHRPKGSDTEVADYMKQWNDWAKMVSDKRAAFGAGPVVNKFLWLNNLKLDV